MARHLIDYSLNAFLKLTAIFSTSHKCSHVERHHSLIKQHPCHLALHNAQSKSLDNSRFAHSRLSYEHRIVLLAATKNLGKALYLLLSADNGIKPSLLSLASHILSKLINHRCAKVVLGLLAATLCSTLFLARFSLRLIVACRLTIIIFILSKIRTHLRWVDVDRKHLIHYLIFHIHTIKNCIDVTFHWIVEESQK